jgi:hypothetical protein
MDIVEDVVVPGIPIPPAALHEFALNGVPDNMPNEAFVMVAHPVAVVHIAEPLTVLPVGIATGAAKVLLVEVIVSHGLVYPPIITFP